MIYLASKSPRRKELLKKTKLLFRTFNVELKEELLDGEHPIQTVKRISLQKMKLAKVKKRNGILITADTIVVLEGIILGKPKNKKDAFKMLNYLSGKKHSVYTGFVISNLNSGKEVVSYEKTDVKFKNLTNDEIKDYIDTGSPMDKAGAYGIQDNFGSLFIERINGCYNNVVGLPVSKVYRIIKEIM